MNDCVFCRLAKHEVSGQDVFYEDEEVFAMIDRDWAVKGHTLVIHKEHVLNMSDLSLHQFGHFTEVCRMIEEKLLRILDLDKSIILKSGSMESHFHFHIYPVNSGMSWESVKDMFDKKSKYNQAEGEKEELLKSLRTI